MVSRSDSVLAARDLSLDANGAAVFAGAEFALAPGDLVHLDGPSGSGKTALGLVCLGLARFIDPGAAVTGTLDLLGAPVVQGRYRPEAAMILEDPRSQVSGLKATVRGELAFGLESRGVPSGDIVRRVEEMLDLLDIARLADRSLATLSGGELGRVVIGAGLIASPRFLFLDRPLTDLDHVFRARLLPLVADRLAGCGGAGMVAEDPWLLPPFAFTGELGLGPAAGDAPVPEPPARTSAPSTSGTVPAFAAEDLSFGWPGAAPLWTLDVAAPPGAVVRIEGPNGSGKTTLARLAAGMLVPRAGRLLVGGRDAAGFTPAERAALVGYAPQRATLAFCRRTVAEELALARRWGNDPGPLPGMLGLDAARDRHPLELTRAEQKRLAAALAWGGRRRVVILDEPTQYQDPASFALLAEGIRWMAAQGAAVLLISHDPRVRDAFADAIVWEIGKD